MIDHQGIEISKNSIFKTQKCENFGSLLIIHEISQVSSLLINAISWVYKQKDIIVPTKYVIDQQDIEISKNRMFKTQQCDNFGSLAPLARNNLWNC